MRDTKLVETPPPIGLLYRYKSLKTYRMGKLSICFTEDHEGHKHLSISHPDRPPHEHERDEAFALLPDSVISVGEDWHGPLNVMSNVEHWRWDPYGYAEED